MLKNKPDVEMRDIPGYEGEYAITRYGRVWSYLKYGVTPNGKICAKGPRWMKNYINNKMPRITFRKNGEKRSFYIKHLLYYTFYDINVV